MNGTQNGLHNGLNLPGKRKASYSVYDESDVLLASGKIKTGKHKNIIVAAGGSEGWTPPDDWDWDTASALITDSDDGFVALVAVFSNKPNYITFKMDYTGGGGTIDWGDGTTSALGASGTTNEKTLSYAGVGGVACDKGYKIATVKILITGTLTSVDYSESHSVLGVSKSFSTPYLAIKQRSQGATMGYVHANPYIASMLELLDLGTDTETIINSNFIAHSSLKKITWVAQSTAFSASGLFEPAYVESTLLTAFDLDDIDWTVCTSMYRCFAFAGGNLGIFEKEIDNVSSLSQGWNRSQVHNSVILTNSGNVTDIGFAVYQSTVSYFSMDNASAVTNTVNFTRNTSGYGQLTNLLLTGLTVGIDISYQPMDATALNAFFTSLGTANGAQTITVIGCIGALTCDTSIATAKGYTVVTS